MANKEILVPDIGDFKNVDIVEVYISAGDVIAVEDPLISIESDKAVMDIPSPFAGKIIEVKVASGSSVSQGDLIALIESSDEDTGETGKKVNGKSGPVRRDTDQGDDAEKQGEQKNAEQIDGEEKKIEKKALKNGDKEKETVKSDADLKSEVKDLQKKHEPQSEVSRDGSEIAALYHATPSVRILARKLGVDLGLIKATGPKGRILKEDLYKTVSSAMKSYSSSAEKGGGSSVSGLSGLPPLPDVSSEDFKEFGAVEEIPLNRIKKLSSTKVHQNWTGIPQVTHFDEADVTVLEDFRKELNNEKNSAGVKYTMLPFILKALVSALMEYPDFNSSLNVADNVIIRKKYYNIGVAVDTPSGLVFIVVKNAERKGVTEIAEELAASSQKARDNKLKLAEIQGSSFSISSLGGIGGTGFTPIVNHPEAAILGISRMYTKPVWVKDKFEPRKVLPFCITYDHRIIDGAQAAYFSKHLSELIGDIRRIILGSPV
ncbi:MAG: 2-oxo acid dehydrogenase subunit E2 [Spirochaetia bacterium]|jgi:pyruvate dehydrogenase E2 component (dihydrolipoamide acetyltransferase)|nr:2-oxo acid dehydrogenase subunit E2 [Spirochaetia bacterium]